MAVTSKLVQRSKVLCGAIVIASASFSLPASAATMVSADLWDIGVDVKNDFAWYVLDSSTREFKVAARSERLEAVSFAKEALNRPIAKFDFGRSIEQTVNTVISGSNVDESFVAEVAADEPEKTNPQFSSAPSITALAVDEDVLENPLPGALPLLISGLAALGFFRSRRRS